MGIAGQSRGPRGAAWAVLGVCLLLPPTETQGQSLNGSARSLDLQNQIAIQHDFTYLRTSGSVERFVGAGYLVRVRGNRDFRLHGVSFPYARPEVTTFVARLAQQYHAACGEQLVVTSLTRPQSRQPFNASSRSVHPTGMAVDLRRSTRRACRSWLESTLLYLEGRGVLEATRERHPAHYHVAVFPKQYSSYVEGLTRRNAAQVAVAESDEVEYRVRRGDSLWSIARSHGTTVEELKSANELRGSRIYAGQLLQVPGAR